MKTLFPVYGETLANLSSSLIRYFGAEAPSPTLKKLDAILEEKQPRNVVLALFDGMGANILRRTLPEDSFLRSHMQEDIYSVFPPTTVAAVAAVESGLYPASTGWLGWNSYFSEVDNVVTTFTGALKGTDTPAADKNLARSLMPYRTMRDLVNEAGKATAHFAHPFGSNPYTSFENLCERVSEKLAGEGRNLMYIYHTQPDEAEHLFGTGSPEATEWIEKLNGAAESIYNAMPEDSMLIVVADHGHTNSETLFLEDYSEIFETLRITTSCEGRATVFFVKDGCHERFEQLFREKLGDKFTLFSAKEVEERCIFGDSVPHERFRSLIGDYLSVGGGDYYLEYERHPILAPAISNHGGTTEDEIMVPFIVAAK